MRSSLSNLRVFVSNLPIHRKGWLVIASPVIALVVSACLLWYTRWNANAADARVIHTLSVEKDIYQIIFTTFRAQSAARDHASSDDRVHAQYQKAKQRIPELLGRLKAHTSDNADQAERVKTLYVLVNEMLARADTVLTAPSESASSNTLSYQQWVDRNKLQMDGVGRVLASMLTEEERLLAFRIQQRKAAAQFLDIAVAISVFLGVLGALFAGRLFTSGITRRIQVLESNALRLERGLPLVPITYCKDEIGRLGVALENASALLADKNDRLKLALRTAKIAIWEIDEASDQLRYEGQDEFLESSDYASDLLPSSGKELFDLVNSQDRGNCTQEFEGALASAGGFQKECRLVSADGAVRFASVTGRACSRGGTSSIVLGVITDITERKRLEQIRLQQADDLAKSEQQVREQAKVLQCVLDSMSDGVVVADQNSRFLLFNPAAQKILGMAAEATAPTEWTNLRGVFSEDQVTPCPVSDQPMARALQGFSVDGQDLFIRPEHAREGTWISASARPLKDGSGSTWGAVVVFRDITGRKQGDEALRAAKNEAENANRAKSEFLSRMSHELRTPLNSILGFAQLLEIDQLTPDQCENVVHVLKGGRHLLNLINEVLDIARVEAGKLALSSEPVRLEDALHEAVDLVGPIAAGRKIRIFRRSTGLWDNHVIADRQRLKQVLLNLLSNAVKYNRDQGSVNIFCAEAGTDRLRIAITDTGHGLTQGSLERLFVPFERLGADDSGVEGTGLGLALSKRLMEAMGGSIGADSTFGVGSTFWIELRSIEHAMNEDDLQTTPHLLPAIDAGRIYSGTLLYIEDNLANVRLMERVLSHRPNVRLITALQGQVGLDLAFKHQPDLIFLDLHLPDIRGDEVLQQLLGHPATQSTPVVMISADATPGQIDRLTSAGAHGFVTKPFDVKNLLSLLDATLGSRKSVC